MKTLRSIKILVLVCLIWIGFSCITTKNTSYLVPVSKPEEVGFFSLQLARIDTLLLQAVRNGLTPNAVTYVYRHGKMVHYKAFGWKNIENREPVQLNSIFRIASQTKALTSVGLMKLYEKKMFLLDDPISKYIPEFANPKVLVKMNANDSSFASRPAKREISIRHLLSHTSGIPYSNVAYTKALIPKINSLKQITIGEVVKKIAKLPLDHDPGEGWTYGLSVDVLGYLIEVLSGQPLDEYLRKEIFKPLEMKDSYFYLPAEKASRLVTLYSNNSPDERLYVCKNVSNQTFPVAGAKTYFSGGAGVVGTIQDYGNFCQMLLNGGTFHEKQILERKTIEMMLQNQIGEYHVWNGKNKFGLGFELATQESVSNSSGSVGAFGWAGAFATNYLIDPVQDMIIIIYINADPFSNRSKIISEFNKLVYKALLPEK
jgi:CubicO group peptidase (beta-lactamase class C family)